MRRQRGDVFAEEADPAGGRQEVAGDGVEQRRLAGAVRAEDRAPFAGRDPHVHPRDRNQRTELTRHAVKLQRIGVGALQARWRQWFRPLDAVPASASACYGQLGFSRLTAPSARNSSSGMPSVWLTCEHDLDELVVEIAVGTFRDFRQVDVGDRVAVLVERHLAGRRVEGELRQRLAQLLAAVGDVAADLVKRQQRCLGVDVVAMREQRRRREGVGLLLVGLDEGQPCRRVVGVGDRAGRRRADDDVAHLALRGQHRLVDGDRTADQRRLAAGLLVLGQEVDAIGAAERHVDRVDIVRNGGDDRGVVLVADRHPGLRRHGAAGLAEFGHEAEHLRVGEGIVFRHGRDLLVALLVEGIGAETGHPLRAVGREAEEVLRRIAQRRVLRRGRAVDEGHVGLRLGVILDGDALVARERADHDLDAVLLDKLAHGAHGAVGRCVGRALDDFDLLAAGHAVGFLDRQHGTAHAVFAENRERRPRTSRACRA